MRTNKIFVIYVLSNFKGSLYCVVCEACYFADRNFGYAAKASASAAVVSVAAAVPTAAAVPAAAAAQRTRGSGSEIGDKLYRTLAYCGKHSGEAFTRAATACGVYCDSLTDIFFHAVNK